MSITILTSSDPFQTLKVRLDGSDYVLSLAYNQREDRWYLSIADDEETPILSGLKLVANFGLLFRHRYNIAVPPGELLVTDTTADRSPPGLAELGEDKRCQLVYFEAATWAQIKAGVDPALVT